jgi:predicted anti-sigma-YlaC factor YlaD
MTPMSECGANGPSSIECRQIAELLGDYLEGAVPRETRELIEWHIEGCAPCVAFVNTYRGTIDAARRLREVEIPAELKKRLLGVLRSQRASHEPRA